MPKQRDTVTLRERLASTEFTPSLRDVEGLTRLLGDPDEAVARGAEAALVRAGSDAAARARLATRVLASLEGATPETRANALKVVGRLAPTDAPAARSVIAGLGDPDARVQKGAAHALGRLQGSEATDEIAAALLAAWDEGPELPVARALAEALGKLGVKAARTRLFGVEGGDPELGRIARNALVMLQRDGSRGESSDVAGDRVGDFEVKLVLLCRAGLESFVADELRETCGGVRGIDEVVSGSGEVTARWRGAPNELFVVRTAHSFAFELPSQPLTSGAALGDACVEALASDRARQILETWTTGDVRYRLAWEGEGHRRGATWKVVHALAERAPRWVNDPTASTWQASIREGRGGVRVRLAPRKLPDPRFTYRLRDVPAASHPTVAAALVRASRPREDDVVWDPFVGSGSELIERARAGPYRALIGSDIDPDALDASRSNFAAAALDGVTLDLADASTHVPPGVRCIVTNPPMGRRVARDGSLGDLLDRFTDHAARVLPSGGRLAWLSPFAGRTAARAEANNLRVTLRRTVDMGGFHAELQVWEKE